MDKRGKAGAWVCAGAVAAMVINEAGNPWGAVILLVAMSIVILAY